MSKSSFNKTEFENLLKKAKYQFILKSDSCIYFINPSKEVVHTETSFVAHNETKNCIDVVDYKDIKLVVCDGQKYFFDQ
ncbi:MAG: hypothetical protein Kow0068_04950 [Marinilabiliales bacterium]